MGFYINPENISKEEFLRKFGTPTTPMAVKAFNFKDDKLPVVLVDNGPFTAAGIAFDAREAQHFLNPADRRPKTWYFVPKANLIPYYNPR